MHILRSKVSPEKQVAPWQIGNAGHGKSAQMQNFKCFDSSLCCLLLLALET